MKNVIKLSLILAFLLVTASCNKDESPAPVAGYRKITYLVNTNFKYLAVKYLNGNKLKEEELTIIDGKWVKTFYTFKNDSLSLYAFGIQSNAGYGSHVEVIIMVDGALVARHEESIDPNCYIQLPNLEAEAKTMVLD